jgi:glyoxylase-like metal-dependent hydrolase (beta-lactamase superfamily II)
MGLLALRQNVFCIKGFVNIGVIVNDRNEAVLVDAGLDERVARRVKNMLDENRFSLKGIIITHAHADHYGGASWLCENSGARIYSSTVEKGVVENPILEPLCLFGGAYPPVELRRKFFHAPKVAVHGTVLPGEAEIEGFPLEVVDLGGHTIGQIGVAVEKVLFCADSLATSGQIKKQGLLKNAGIEQSLQTLERLKTRNDLVFVPSHGEIYNDIRPLVAANQELINHTLSVVLSMTDEPIGVEDLLAQFCARKGVTVKSLSQYYVLHLSILAYLGCLLDRSQISVVFDGNKQLFQRRVAADNSCS